MRTLTKEPRRSLKRKINYQLPDHQEMEYMPLPYVDTFTEHSQITTNSVEILTGSQQGQILPIFTENPSNSHISNDIFHDQLSIPTHMFVTTEETEGLPGLSPDKQSPLKPNNSNVDVNNGDTVQESFSVLKNLVPSLLPCEWSLQISNDGSITCYQMQNITAIKSITVSDYGTYTIKILDKPVTNDIEEFLKLKIPLVYNSETLRDLINEVDFFKLCLGNPEFTHLNSHADEDLPEAYNYCFLTQTVRAKNCEIITFGKAETCKYCIKLKKVLKKRALRESVVKRKRHLRHFNYRELLEHAKLQRKILNVTLKKMETIKQKFRSSLANGVSINQSENCAYIKILESNINEIEKNDLHQLMLQEQLKAAKATSVTGIRWDPTILKICAYLHSKSSSCYESLRSTGLIKLPSSRTLTRHGVHFRHTPGFHKEVLQDMKECAKLDSLEDCNKYFSLVIDEMVVKLNIVFDKHTGEIIGFTEMNSIEEEVIMLEGNVSNELPTVATHMLALFVRGLTSDFKYAFAHFPTSNLTANFLMQVVWEGIARLEETGFRILCIVADGAGPNRKFFNLCSSEKLHSCLNPFSFSEERPIFFIADLPHAIKTILNQFFQSNNWSKARRLWRRGQEITFEHLLQAHNTVVGSEYRINWKLKHDDIYLTSFSKMNVGRAFRAMSNNTASAIEIIVGKDASETCKFIRNVNRFADCLNSHLHIESLKKNNPDLKPYEDINDERLKWLTDEFLADILNWKQEIVARDGFTKTEKEKMFLGEKTLETIKLCVLGITEAIQFLLQKDVKYVMAAAFNQDVLEQEFGRQRGCMGNNQNPTVQQFSQNTKRLNAVRKYIMAPKSGNTSIR